MVMMLRSHSRHSKMHSSDLLIWQGVTSVAFVMRVRLGMQDLTPAALLDSHRQAARSDNRCLLCKGIPQDPDLPMYLRHMSEVVRRNAHMSFTFALTFAPTGLRCWIACRCGTRELRGPDTWEPQSSCQPGRNRVSILKRAWAMLHC